MDIERLIVAACLMALTACGPGDRGADAGGPAVEFDTAAVRIETATDTIELVVEVAATARQQRHGLMEREQLPADRGMLFVYDEPQEPASEFYMFRTRIPLDIAFVGDDGRIANIRAMEPCAAPNPNVCRRYAAEVPFVLALEVNRGFFARHGVGVGDRVVWLESGVAGDRESSPEAF